VVYLSFHLGSHSYKHASQLMMLLQVQYIKTIARLEAALEQSCLQVQQLQQQPGRIAGGGASTRGRGSHPKRAVEVGGRAQGWNATCKAFPALVHVQHNSVLHKVSE
jgi:hypothetical protein